MMALPGCPIHGRVTAVVNHAEVSTFFSQNLKNKSHIFPLHASGYTFGFDKLLSELTNKTDFLKTARNARFFNTMKKKFLPRRRNFWPNSVVFKDIAKLKDGVGKLTT